MNTTKLTTEEMRDLIRQQDSNIDKIIEKLKELNYEADCSKWVKWVQSWFGSIEINKITWNLENTIISLSHNIKTYLFPYEENYEYEYIFEGFYDKDLKKISNVEEIPQKVENLVFKGNDVYKGIINSYIKFGLGAAFDYKCISLPFDSFMTKKITLKIKKDAR